MNETFLDSEDGVPQLADPVGGHEAFHNLALRAEAYIAERGGRANEDVLISHVFGSAGSVELWRPLLRDILGRHDAVRFRADGAWLLADQPASDSSSPIEEFAVLDVETTGLQPSRQRIIEIAIVRFSGGISTNSWETLCNPGRQVPRYIAKLTGIDDGLLLEAPAFEAVADTVVDLLRDAIVVGHNVEFDLGFVNEELKRLGRAPVVNERLDTLMMASRLLPGLRKPSLRTIARHLGLVDRNPREAHRAGPDAMLTGVIAVSLLGQARDAGYRTVDEIKGIAQPATRRPKERMPRASSVVDRSMLAAIPHAPGVYVMRDASDRVVYVGKAKDLRDRVGSYFSQPLGYTRKMDGLIESLSRIQVEVVGSELEALLLESQLIRRYQPRYNTALRSHEQYPFIRVDIGNPWPRISLAKSRKDDGARYFGPFRSAATARKTVDLINRVVPLRTCTRSFRDARSYGSPCIQLDLGRCLGPCVGRADRDRYMAFAYQVIDYVDGRDQALHEVLWQGLEDAAAALDFERASRLRRDLQASLSLTAAQRRLREATESNRGLLVTPSPEAGCRELMLIVQGRIWAQVRVNERESAEAVGQRLELSWRRYKAIGLREADHDSVDDVHILGAWLARHEGVPAFIRFAGNDDPDWRAIAARALGLRGEELDFDAWRKSRVAEGGDWDEPASVALDTTGLEAEARVSPH